MSSTFMTMFLLLFSHQVVSDSMIPWIAPCQASLSLTISGSLLKFMSIESVIPSNHLILCCPRLLLPSIFPRIGVLSNQSAVRIQRPKYWNFSFSISPSKEYSGLISFKIFGLVSLLSKGLSRVFYSTTVRKHQFFSILPSFFVQLSHLNMTTGKTIALTIWTFVSRVMSLLFKTLSRFVIGFLLRSSCLLISWLQSSSTVILELKKRFSLFPPFPFLFLMK